ncbi:MAG: hypothetical protein HQ568_11770, partial [Calditrichaeota bacterium]|nr:hypothetical protein [Calditrichota bacterium]
MQRNIPISLSLLCILIIFALILTLINPAMAQSDTFPTVKVSKKGQLPASTTGSVIDKPAHHRLESALFDMLIVRDQQDGKA